MRKLILVLLLFLGGTIWWYRYETYYYFYSRLHSDPLKLEFAEHPAPGVRIHYVRSPYLDAQIVSLGRTLSSRIAAAEKDVGIEPGNEIEVYLYNDWEEKGTHVEFVSVAHADVGSEKVYCIVNDQLNGLIEGLEYEILLHRKWGKPFRGEIGRLAAAGLSGIWDQKSLDEWAEFLLSRNLPPHLTEFLAGRGTYSRYWTSPWNALFIRFLKDRYGWPVLEEFYRTGKVRTDYTAAWEEELRRWTPSTPLPTFRFEPRFQKGISYGYYNTVDGGYPTRKSERSLNKLQEIGVQWIAAIPYGFMKRPNAPDVHRIGNKIWGESDESMLALVMQARRRGMMVMMKPQLWIGHDSWPGGVDLPDEASWNRWFESYENWIVHYAILSELIGADQFCMGTELVNATLKHPERWRTMIRRVRQIYLGPVTYAANWGKEFEQIPFWDELDYIGLDNYYPVRRKEEDGAEEMESAFLQQKERIATVARKFGKPVIFTEIGYHATEGAGMGPNEDDYDGYDAEMQAECYRQAFETYWNEPWFYGMYWWKWFSNPDDSGRKADVHSPHGRPAEDVLRIWYAKRR